MIEIVNISEQIDHNGENEYEVRLNNVVKARFKHKESEGMVVCLRKALEAVTRTKMMTAAELLTGKI